MPKSIIIIENPLDCPGVLISHSELNEKSKKSERARVSLGQRRTVKRIISQHTVYSRAQPRVASRA